MAVDRLRGRRGAARPRRARTPTGARRATASISGDEVARAAPGARRRARPPSGYLFYDCQTDDARLVLTVLAEAERFGAVGANRLEALELLEERRARRRRPRARRRDAASELEVRAANVVNATGVWADRLRPERAARRGRGARHPAQPRHAHHARARDAAADARGAIVPAGGGRTIFVLPWLGQTLIGTTDNDYEGDGSSTSGPPREDIDYLLDAVNAFFAHRRSTPATSRARTRACGR